MLRFFNTREIATIFWFAIMLIWLLPKAEIRKSLVDLSKSFFQYKILVSVFTMMLYTAASIVLLNHINLWDTSLIKDTIVWFCASAMVMVVRFITSTDSQNVLQRVLVENLKIIIILEFLVNTYTFSLPIELVFVPILAIIVMADVYASYNDHYKEASRYTKGLLSVIGFFVLVFVALHAIYDLKALVTFDNARSIFLSPLLSLLFIPCLYMLVLVSKYEELFMRLNIGVEKDRRLKRYVRIRIIMSSRLSMSRINHLLRNHSLDLMRISDKSGVDRILLQAMHL